MTIVTLLTPTYFPIVGGVEVHVRDLAWGLRKHNITARVISLCDTRKYEPSKQLKCKTLDGVPVTLWSSCSSGSLIPQLTMVHYFPFPLPRLRKKMSSSDILHFHDDSDLSFAVSAMGISKPRLFTCHSQGHANIPSSYARRVIARNIFKNSANLFHVFSSRDLKSLSKLGVVKDKIRIIPHGVDINALKPSRERHSHNAVRIVWVGRIASNKGLNVLLRAVKILKNEFRNFELLIAGEVWENDYYQELVRYKDAMGLHEVRFLGFIENLTHFLQQGDIFVMPSFEETFGIVNLEAMACGLPVVASAIGAIPEIVVESETGYLVPPGDTEALADKLRPLIRDAKLRRSMGRNGRRRAESNFSLEDMCKSILKVYQELV